MRRFIRFAFEASGAMRLARWCGALPPLQAFERGCWLHPVRVAGTPLTDSGDPAGPPSLVSGRAQTVTTIKIDSPCLVHEIFYEGCRFDYSKHPIAVYPHDTLFVHHKLAQKRDDCEPVN